MKKLCLLPLIALSLVACDRHDHPNSPPVTLDKDNTGINVRDRDMNTKTSGDQSESEADRTITQKIRQEIVADDSLSANAKNIKIVTINGTVTLRGPVGSTQERESIARKVSAVQGVLRLDNQLEVTRS